ncbi:MAG TPA: Ran-binding zinc finger domain-containing protein [Actinomycetota bacterium]|nr:Ran-binding zinc finger domain-containing protein [Actinomycetota bacterium]
MPDIVFQLLMLLLLLLNLVALLGVLNAINAMRKDLASGPGVTGASPRTGGADLSLGTAPEQSFAQPAASYQPSYAAPEQRQEVSTGFVPMSEAAPATSAPQSQGQGFGGEATGPTLRGDEPEEQPFERDGRWWFKRGGELLVYDEGTGQWVSPGAGATTATHTTTSFGTAASSVATAETAEGWKCSSCGAVNGSTATTCRMCFSPR